MRELLAYDFMQRALLAALLVGCTAPLVGVFLVQRRLSLIGDGMGHVALAGVAIGVLTSQQPVVTALVVTIASAMVMELIRVRGRTSGDVALALMFYGGIGLGVVLLARAPAGGVSMNAYLFGSITTTSGADLWAFGALAAVVLVTTLTLRPSFFAVANDEEYARAAGLPVMTLNLTLAVLTAVTVVLSMRVVGLLLISALMIVPNAAAQLLARSFRSGMLIAVVIGVSCALGGVATSFYAGTPSGGTIVILAVAVYALIASVTGVAGRVRDRSDAAILAHEHEHGPDCGHVMVPHGDHTDYLHDGHLHHPHGGHYDEHGTSRLGGDDAGHGGEVGETRLEEYGVGHGGEVGETRLEEYDLGRPDEKGRA